MIKTYYQKELEIAGTQRRRSNRNNKRDVMKIQAWLSLFEMAHPGSGTSTSIDGDFGPATEKAVMNFQRAIQDHPDGVVNKETFDWLCLPLRQAFEARSTGNSLRKVIVDTAYSHLKNLPYELVIKKQSNSGPWVRSYMDGHEGDPWFWCMGFVQTIVDQAASQLGKSFKQLMPHTYSCDTVGATGLQRRNLTRYFRLRRDPSLAEPGDIFLVQRTRYDWIHTGIITSVDRDTFECIEGNTSTDGSRNGNAVYKRIRNFRKSKLDVFSVSPLTG